MLYRYKTIQSNGAPQEGTIEAVNKDLAIAALQRRDLIVVSIEEADKKKNVLQMTFFERVSMKDIVILSRQISTLFEAQVSALKAFTVLAGNTENKLLAKKINQVTDDIKAGSSISDALTKHPGVFSSFYVNMVRAGEESGKLTQTFSFLADYLDRQYALTSKTRNALIYPAFVIGVFFVVMALMFVLVIPKLSAIILESGQEVPFYTKIVIAMSDFFVNYGIFVLLILVVAGVFLWQLARTKQGREYLDGVKLSVPILGKLYSKLYLARLADNMNTMLSSGIPIVRAIEITSAVVGNSVYQKILTEATEGVKNGRLFSESLSNQEHIPAILVQMIKVGEETGSIGSILSTLSKFYRREVDDAVDTLVSLIEPVMIVLLGLGVGILLVSVLLPIYNIAGGIQ